MLCVRLFFVSLSFVLTPFSLCRHKMEVNEEPLTPERRQGIKVGDTVHVYNGSSSGTQEVAVAVARGQQMEAYQREAGKAAVKLESAKNELREFQNRVCTLTEVRP